MDTVRSLRSQAICFLLAGLSYSCDPWFAYSPYAGNVEDAYLSTTEKNMARINAIDAGDGKPFKVALLADPHYHFSKLEDAIRRINSDPDYAFAIVAGDLTENGLLQEFVFFHDIMAGLNIPYLTVIGNHDYLSNGEMVYAEMYGPYNYTFEFNNTRFVLFDNNTIESEKQADLDWFAKQLVNDGGYDHVIPIAHIPPYDVQMAENRDPYHRLLIGNQIPLSIHGHRHDFSKEDVSGDGIYYVTVSSPQKRTFTELTVSPQAVEVKKIEY